MKTHTPAVMPRRCAGGQLERLLRRNAAPLDDLRDRGLERQLLTVLRHDRAALRACQLNPAGCPEPLRSPALRMGGDPRPLGSHAAQRACLNRPSGGRWRRRGCSCCASPAKGRRASRAMQPRSQWWKARQHECPRGVRRLARKRSGRQAAPRRWGCGCGGRLAWRCCPTRSSGRSDLPRRSRATPDRKESEVTTA